MKQVLEGPLGAGVHESAWDGRGSGGTVAAPGLYFARLRSQGHEAASKFVVVR